MKVVALQRAAVAALVLLCAPLLSAQEAAAAATKVAIINIQDAITRTQQGQQLIQDLQQKYEPRSKEIEAINQRINDLRAQLNKGANTMSDEARRDLTRQIQTQEKEAQRTVEDARGEFNQEQQTIFNEVGSKLIAVVTKYSQDNGFAVVLDISSPQSPVLYAANETNITNAVIMAYDTANPVETAAAPPAGE